MGKPARATIQINGQTYDALSGQLVSDAPKTVKPSKPKATAHSGGQSIGGMVHSPSRTAPKPPSSKTVHARTKRPTTLDRAAVKKTKTSAHHTRHAPAPVEDAHQLDAERLKRANAVHQSHAISKFGPSTPATAQPIAPVTELAPPPAEPVVTAPVSAKEQLIAKHLAQVAATSSAQPKARAHHRVKKWLKHPRRTTILATSASALLLVGYITYINIPNMALRVASSRAGFAAHLPGYQPAGFSFSGPVAYQPGEITVSYGSHDSDRAYRITQKESNWDSQTLLDHIEPQAELYPATYQESGLTVYVYDGKVATWVNAGVWYTVDNDTAQLTTEQMLKIAASL